ncbi:MAG: hypothetical protein WCJ35_28615 [Planctomycetota bacterium]
MMLYVGGDGAASFQAMFHGNRVVPALVAIIQPGHGFGFNWTNFEDENLIFARSVLQNSAGIPEYLIYGGWGSGHFYSEPCWPSYCQNVRRLNGNLGLWRRPA